MAALARMRPRDRGTIVQVGSALGYRAIPLQSAYCGAKHAVNGFTESVRCELLHDGSHVRITVVQMPAVNTPQFSWVLSRLPRQPAAGPADLPAGGRRPGGRLRGRPPRPQGALGRRVHGGDDRGPEVRRPAARPLPRPHRLRLAADEGAGRRRPAEQPVAAGRPGAGQRPRRARRLRRPVHARSAQLDVTERVEEAAKRPAVAGRGARQAQGRGRSQRRDRPATKASPP